MVLYRPVDARVSFSRFCAIVSILSVNVYYFVLFRGPESKAHTVEELEAIPSLRWYWFSPDCNLVPAAAAAATGGVNR